MDSHNHKELCDAVRTRDERTIYETALDDIAASITETRSARDKAALWKRLFETMDRLNGLPDTNAELNPLQAARMRAFERNAS